MLERVIGFAVLLATAGTIPSLAQEPVRSFLWKQCNEDVLFVQVDPEPFRELAGDEFSLSLEDGRARVLIAVQDCPTYYFGGDEIGPTHEVHQWVAVEGPKDIRPVPGAERTLPTMTWLAVFTGSSNPQSRAHWGESGTPASSIERLSLDPAAEERGGSVVVGEGFGYSWRVRSGAPFARLVGVNHDVYARGAGGSVVYNRIQCLANVYAWGSPATLTVEKGTDPRGFIGPGEHPAAVHSFLPLWCRANLADAPAG